MRNIVFAFVLSIVISGCAGLQQIGQSAADNAKPASPPVLTEHPPSSALWPEAPTTFHIAGRLFAVNLTHNLFNTISVKLGGRQAVELARGSSGGYPPIDRSQLATGNVFFRLTSLSSDANQQIENDLLEVVDMDNAIIDLPLVTSTVDLVVGETSVNPAFAGTSDAFKETTRQVVFSRAYTGPPGSGGVSKCTFDLSNPFASVGYYAPPGGRVAFNVDSDGCKSIGFLFLGQPLDMVVYPAIAPRFDAHTFTVPATANDRETINFQVLGLDLLKRRSYYNVEVIVRTATTPPPLPCAANNGNGGHKSSFVFCASCPDSHRFRYQGDYCNTTDAQTGANNVLSAAGQTNCSLTAGECTLCPTDSSNPAGLVQNFPYCAACPAGQFAWNIADGSQPACSRDDATQYVQASYGNCTVASSLAQTFEICVQCPGQAENHTPVRACTDVQALDIARAATSANCSVRACP